MASIAPDLLPSAESVWKKPGLVYTFYSYKGGVGRSMALANIAALLARRGRRVLIVDWDLEAPGIERFFVNAPSRLLDSRADKDGLVDLVESIAAGTPLDWRTCLLSARPFEEGLNLSILHAGRDNDEYVRRVQSLNWRRLFEEADFGNALERLRTEWIGEYDYVFIDSRTGITDIGGLCTIHLPDVLVLLFTTNEQSLAGVLDVMKRARQARRSLPFDRARLVSIPVPARDEALSEHDNAMQWRARFTRELRPLYEEWLPPGKRLDEVLAKLSVVYKSYWSFGERLPVVEEKVIDPKGPASSYQLLADLIDRELQWDRASTDTPEMLHEREALATAQRAEQYFVGCDDAHQQALLRLFRRLVRIGRPDDADRFARQKVDVAELPPECVEALRETANLKLVDIERNETGAERAQLSNDHLLRAWDRLLHVLEQEREFLLWKQKIRTLADEWNAHGRAVELLLAGAHLTEIARWRDRVAVDVGPVESKFLAASEAHAARTKRRKAALQVAVGVLLALAIGAYYYSQQLRLASPDFPSPETDAAAAPADADPAPSVQIPAAKESEPNGSVSQATALPQSERIAGSLTQAGDNDYFAYQTGDVLRDVYELFLTTERDSAVPRVDGLDADMNVLWSERPVAGSSILRHQFVLEPRAKYFFRVRADAAALIKVGEYTLSVAPLMAYDAYEPNDEFVNATRVKPGASLSANILDSRDRDYYTFRSEGRTVVEVKSDDDASLGIRIYDRDRKQVDEFDATHGRVAKELALVPLADYYLRVNSANDQLNTPYSLAIR